jgi:hypothetical protein
MHNQTKARFGILHDDPIALQFDSHWGLSKEELKSLPERVSQTYEHSVYDANQWMLAADKLLWQNWFMSVILLLTSIIGLYSLRRISYVQPGDAAKPHPRGVGSAG